MRKGGQRCVQTDQRGRLDGGEAALVLVVLGLAALVRGGRPQARAEVPVDPLVPVVLMVLFEENTQNL